MIIDDNKIRIIFIRIIVLFVFWKLIRNTTYLKKYKKDIQFSVYRSLMCLNITIIAFENVITNFSAGFKDAFYFKNNKINNLNYLFISYLIFDLMMMIYLKNTRIDLYIHHILCLFAYLLADSYNCMGYYYNFILLNESMSIVSGIDRIYREEKQFEKSVNCKKYRVFIINYIRLPIWIITAITILYNTESIPYPIRRCGLISSFIMLLLDTYWKNKCLKVINKNAKKYTIKNLI